MNTLELTGYFEAQLPELLSTIKLLVEQETPSHDKPRLDAFAALLAGRLAATGAMAEVIPNPTHGNHVRAHFTDDVEDVAAPPALVLCHYDTVWPVGALATHPFRIEDGQAYGPGIFDMKAGLVQTIFALLAIREFGILRGSVLGIWRIMRCNPWSHGGFDPVHEQTLFARRSPEQSQVS